MSETLHTSAPARAHSLRSVESAIVALALVLRVGAVLIGPEPALSPNAEGAFIGGAERLLDGEGFRDPTYPMFSPPLYALTIAASFGVFGRHTLPIRLGQAVLDTATVLLVIAIGRRVFGRRAGLATGALAAVYPFTIYAADYVGTEALFGFLLAALVWVSLRAVSTRGLGLHAAAGLLMGIASLTRGSTQFYPVAWAATLWLAGRRDRAAVARWAVASLCFAAVIAPWTLRNWIVWHSFIPLSTSAAPLLCGASEEFFTIDGRVDRMDLYFEQLAERGLQRPAHGDVLGWESFYFSAAREKYLDRWKEGGVPAMAAFFAAKFARLWYATESGHNHALIFAANLPFYTLAVGGIVLAFRRRLRLAWLPAMPVLYLAGLHTVVYPYFRYIVPVMPLALCFSGCALAALMERLGLLRRPDPSLGGSS